MIIKQLTVGHMKVFCYILACEETRSAIVIDPGGEEERLLEYIREEKLHVTDIMITHNHPDHTFGNRKIKEATGSSIVMHEDDRSLMDEEETVQYFKRLDFPVSDTPPPDRLVRDGDNLVFGNHSVNVIHIPGHSPGSICMLCEGNLFTGDSLFVGGAGRVDLPAADFNTLVDSLEKKIAILPEEIIVWPGHDYSGTKNSTIGREKKDNPYLGGDWP